jgi:nucleoside-diphosphate-sugar epimerase
MSKNGSSVLITGANGFVGSRLCRLFTEKGYHVIAGVRKTADLSLLEGIEVEYRYGDVTDQESLPAMVTGVDYIIHNAGVVKAKKAETFYNVNEKGTISLVDATIKHNPNIKKLIYISSLAAAGPALEGKPVTESDEPHPISEYGKSKLAAEASLMPYFEKIPIVILRPSGVYGPGDKEIFTFFDSVNKGLKAIVGNPDRRIQIVHVDDLCRGVLMALEKATKTGKASFIAEQQSYSMRELVNILGESSGRKCMTLHIPGGIFKIIAFISEFLFKLVGATPMLTREKAAELLASWEVSTEKAYNAFGFVSEISFKDGSKETYKWYREHGWLK